MKDFVGIFGDGIGRLVQSFLLPAVAAVAIWCFFNFDAAATTDGSVYEHLRGVGAASQLLVLAGVSMVLALIFGILTPPTIRILEGYWPGRNGTWGVRWLFRWRQRAERARRRKVIESLNESIGEGATARDDWTANASAFRRFPQPGERLMPTRLGNVLLAGELYGSRMYELDSVLMWDQLWAAANDPVRDMLTSRRAHLDLVISTGIAGVVYVAVTLHAAAATKVTLSAVVVAAAFSLGLGICAYGAAIQVAKSYADAMVALVETARLPLAESLGIQVPASLDKERDLWLAVTSRLMWGRAAADSELESWAKTVERARTAYMRKS